MTYKKKLIEVALPLAMISDASSRDKAIKHGHPDNLHQWWARRPLPSARAVLFGSLVDDPSGHPELFPSPESQHVERERLKTILLNCLAWDSSDDHEALSAARAEILKSTDGKPPIILDPFGGGGCIPLEAQRLGLTVLSGDLNPVAVLIQKAMVEFPALFSGTPAVHPDSRGSRMSWAGADGLAADILSYGQMVVESTAHRLAHLYPSPEPDASALAWIWARTVRSPDPSWPGHVPLVSTWILRKKPGKPLLWINPVIDTASHTVSYEMKEGGTPPDRTVDGGRGICIATGATIRPEYIKEEAMAGRMGYALLAVAYDSRRGRSYRSPDPEQIAAASCDAPETSVDGALSTHPQYMGTPRYGLTKWSDLFTPRQLVAMVALADEVVAIRQAVESDAIQAGMDASPVRLADGGSGAAAYADAVVTYLSFVHDKVLDLNCNLTAWKKDAECPVHLFGRQAIPMVWDFAESNPFGDASGSFRSSLRSVAAAIGGKGFRMIDALPGQVRQLDAISHVKSVDSAMICTDPPYYAQVPYADISDFFYVWTRRKLSTVWPDICATLATPKNDELVADERRHGSKAGAAKFFEKGMLDFFTQVADCQDKRFPAIVFYAYKQSDDGTNGASSGWDTFLTGLLRGGFAVTATWPIRTENKSRLRAMGSNALASSVVLACRLREIDAIMATRGEFIAALRAEMPSAILLLQEENIAPVDMAQSAIGPGIAVFSRYAKVVEADGSTMSVGTALTLINEVLSEILSGEESEFDADTRFAVTWFEQYGHKAGPFGDADSLARAKNTTVAGVANAGIALSRDGKVHLVERSDLPENWDPAKDSRLTVWETTQHLIRNLEASESDAASLLRSLGAGIGDRSRQLAYLLYGICDRKRWTEDASAYNMLVTAWPEISRLAATSLSPGHETSLF